MLELPPVTYEDFELVGQIPMRGHFIVVPCFFFPGWEIKKKKRTRISGIIVAELYNFIWYVNLVVNTTLLSMVFLKFQ